MTHLVSITKYCRVLQSITEYYRVLQGIAGHCRVFQSIAEYCRVLQSITESFRVLQSITEYCRILQSIAECYRVLQSVTECHRVLQSVTECNRVLHSITEYFYLDQFLGLFNEKLHSHKKLKSPIFGFYKKKSIFVKNGKTRWSKRKKIGYGIFFIFSHKSISSNGFQKIKIHP